MFCCLVKIHNLIRFDSHLRCNYSNILNLLIHPKFPVCVQTLFSSFVVLIKATSWCFWSRDLHWSLNTRALCSGCWSVQPDNPYYSLSVVICSNLVRDCLFGNYFFWLFLLLPENTSNIHNFTWHFQ
jgi:hypothetical protein